MRRVGQARRRDVTERPIIDALRAVGAFVVPISGDGAPDLLVRYRRRWTPLEVKGPKTKIRAKQAEAEYPIVRSVDEALAIVTATCAEDVYKS